MSDSRSLSRRDLLRAGGGAALGSLSGCQALREGDAGGSCAPLASTTTAGTGTRRETTTTAVPSRDALAACPTEVGPYADWMLAVEGASLFLFTYYPRYSWLLDRLPDNDDWGRRVLRWELTSNSHPTGLVEPANVAEYFYGFTDANELTYHVLWGDLDADHIVSTATEEHLGEGDPGLRGFTATSEDVGEFDTYYREKMVFGVTPDMMVVVNGAYPDRGYYASMQNLRRVRDAVRGEGESFTDANENYALLTEKLQRGHKLVCRPLTAKRLGLGTYAYARQYTLASPEFSLVDDVLVFDERPSESAVRETVTGSDLYRRYPVDETGIDEVTIDGRTAVVRYPPVPNARVYMVPGY